MSEEADFNIEQWRAAFDADMEAVKASMEAVAAQMQPYMQEVVNELFGDRRLTDEDCVMLWSFHIKAEEDICGSTSR